MKQKIQVVEVGPRDGFQNIPEYIPLGEKIKIIDGLVEAGISHMQITSFVSPKAIPQMKDAKEVAAICLDKYPALDLFALVPNLYGAKTAAELGMKKIANVISLSESHNKANINRTHQESIQEIQNIKDKFPDMDICVDVATAFGCPFEGKPTVDKLVNFVGIVYNLGIRSFNICDTIGVANPLQVRTAITAVRKEFLDCDFQVHIHDTRNMGIVNTLAAIECGVTNVQSTLGGLGGCPFAPGASGNTATEDLVFLLTGMGYETGVDFEKILTIAKYEHQTIKGTYSGHHINIGNTCQ